MLYLLSNNKVWSAEHVHENVSKCGCCEVCAESDLKPTTPCLSMKITACLAPVQVTGLVESIQGT